MELWEEIKDTDLVWDVEITEVPLSKEDKNTFCKRCGNKVQPEYEADYPWDCPTCDENMYNFEVEVRMKGSRRQNKSIVGYFVHDEDGNCFEYCEDCYEPEIDEDVIPIWSNEAEADGIYKTCEICGNPIKEYRMADEIIEKVLDWENPEKGLWHGELVDLRDLMLDYVDHIIAEIECREANGNYF